MSPLVSQAVLEEVRQASDIATVIGSYFQLQRSGSAFKALCPFHKEKTPSFMVNPQRQIFHCFGCGAGGDVFRFVMDYEKVDFISAVKMLAQKANIRLAFDNLPPGDAVAKEALYELMAGAARLYHEILMRKPEGAAARKYLTGRDINGRAAEEFTIGWAPDRPDTIAGWAGKKYAPAQLEAAGLVLTTAGGRRCDRFRNRLMFAVHDEQGRVVGFSGRTIGEIEGVAKYVNTPDTILFHKGRLLYAIHRARRAIVDKHEAIVCEGQIDVLRCHLAGFDTAVAAQGTAFTDDHARILKRYADGVVLAFDGDAAGRKAALRAAEVFLRAGMAVRVACLPEGADPDSLIRGPNGADTFRALLEKAKSAVDFQVDVLSGEIKPDTDAGLMRISSAVLATIAQAAGAVQRARMLQTASARLGIPEQALRSELSRAEKRVRPDGGEAALQPGNELPAREMALVEHLLTAPQLAALAGAYLPLDLLKNDACRGIVKICLEAVKTGKDVMGLLAVQDDDQRTLAALAARALDAPAKIKSDFSTHEESVKSLILAIRGDALRRQRKEIETRLRSMQVSGAAPGAERKQLEIEYCQLGYDLVKMRQWDTALPIMKIT